MRATAKQKRLIHRWQTAKKKLASAKAEEKELFDAVEEELFSKAKKGTTSIDLGKGYGLKRSAGETYSVDPDEAKVALKKLPRGMRKKLLKESVSLIKKGYDALTEEQRDIFDECITVKPKKPVLEFIEPEEKDG